MVLIPPTLPGGIVSTVVAHAKEALAARRRGDTGAAEAAAREALSVAQAGASEGAGRDGLILALSVMAQLDHDAGRVDAATQRYAEAAELSRVDPVSPRLPHVLRHLGLLHLRARNLLAAISCCEEALAIRRADGDTPPLELANTIRPLALIREAEGRSREATELWKEAESLYSRAGVDSGVEECRRRMAALADS